MDTDGSAANFYTIDHHVVGIGAYGSGISGEERNVFRLGGGEGVVHCVEALRLFVPLE